MREQRKRSIALSARDATEQQELLRQQTTLARFGDLALRSDDLDHILTEACRLVGEALGTDLAKVVQVQEDGETLLVRAGVGWKPGVVGQVKLRASEDTSEGHALRTGEPTISADIEKEQHSIRAVPDRPWREGHRQRHHHRHQG